MSRPATIFGLPQGSIIWNPDFKASLDDKGLWTASVTFTCRSASLTTLLPAIGSPCQESGFGFLGLVSFDIANNEGDTSTVTCKYTGTVSPDYGFDDDDEIPYTTSLTIATSEEPIETHPRYREGEFALTTEQRLQVAQFKAGRLKIQEVEEGEITKLVTRVDDKDIGFIEVTEGGFREIINKINNGITSYSVPHPIYRYNITQKQPPTTAQLNAVGKTGNPPKAPTVGEDRNWLLVGVNYDYNGTIYNISQEWELSGVGGWDEELYPSQS